LKYKTHSGVIASQSINEYLRNKQEKQTYF